MLAEYIILAILLIASMICDIREYRVRNMITLPALAAGLGLSFIKKGPPGLAGSAIAAFIPAAALFALYALRMLGAGDIKLFCAIGAIMGVKYVLRTMAFSFLAGGIMALIIMAARGNLRERLRHIRTYLKTCVFTGSIVPYTDFGDKSDGSKFHFSPAIAAGCLIACIF